MEDDDLDWPTEAFRTIYQRRRKAARPQTTDAALRADVEAEVEGALTTVGDLLDGATALIFDHLAFCRRHLLYPHPDIDLDAVILDAWSSSAAPGRGRQADLAAHRDSLLNYRLRWDAFQRVFAVQEVRGRAGRQMGVFKNQAVDAFRQGMLGEGERLYRMAKAAGVAGAAELQRLPAVPSKEQKLAVARTVQQEILVPLGLAGSGPAEAAWQTAYRSSKKVEDHRAFLAADNPLAERLGLGRPAAGMGRFEWPSDLTLALLAEFEAPRRKGHGWRQLRRFKFAIEQWPAPGWAEASPPSMAAQLERRGFVVP